MIYRMSTVPIVTISLSVSITARTHSGSVFLWDGPWAAIRRFLTLHLISAYGINAIEDQLGKHVEQTFEIETSETLLTLAGFLRQPN